MTTIPDIPSTHDNTAHAIRGELKRLVEGIRGVTLLTPAQRRRYTVSGHVDDDFLRRMSLLIDAHPEIATIAQLTSAEILDHLNFSGSHDGVGEELILHGRKVIDTCIAERGSIGERAIRALKIARSLNTPAGRESLVPHLEAIDRDFARGRRKRPVAKKPDEAAEPKPVVKP